MLSRVRAFATHTLGFAHVFDTTFAREIALREHAREFFERKERAVAGGGSDCDGALPMLSSACPGWVCYAEKTHGEMLPFIASTKSPQQVMGTLVKEWLGPYYWDKQYAPPPLSSSSSFVDRKGVLSLGLHRPDEVYHVTVMPCYDKKLEASRSDFYNEQYATRDVDCVLTTGELLLLAQEHDIDLSLPVPDEDVSPSPSSASATPVFPDLHNPAGSSSGSYLYSLMLAVARTHPHPLTLESKTVRSADYVEYTLRDTFSGGPPVFRGATCYGFRNLQNVVRRVGRAAGVQVGRGAAGRLAGGLRGGTGTANNRTANGAGAAYDYVEVMACPGGCVGGGGQLRPPERKTANGTGTNDDAEGFARDWAADGVVGTTGAGGTGQEDNSKTGTTRTRASAADREAPWSSRAWTREVERAYWGGGPAPALELGLGLGHASLPTPPASPKIRSGLSEGIVGMGMGGTSAAESCGTSHRAEEEGVASLSPTSTRSRSGRRLEEEEEAEEEEGLAADRSAERHHDDDDVDDVEALVERALRELCAPVEFELEKAARVSADRTRPPGPGRRNFWMARMDEDAEARRRAYFRTQYRAVESEVVGLGVKW